MALTPARASPVDIRIAGPVDLPAVSRLVEQYWHFEGIEEFSRERIDHLLMGLVQQPALGSLWIAASDDQVIAYLLAVHVFSLEHGGVMTEIDEFFVDPAWRSQGVGQRLLDTVESALRAQASVRIQLQLGTGNLPARHFYRRAGYAERSGYELLDKPL